MRLSLLCLCKMFRIHLLNLILSYRFFNLIVGTKLTLFPTKNTQCLWNIYFKSKSEADELPIGEQVHQICIHWNLFWGIWKNKIMKHSTNYNKCSSTMMVKTFSNVYAIACGPMHCISKIHIIIMRLCMNVRKVKPL